MGEAKFFGPTPGEQVTIGGITVNSWGGAIQAGGSTVWDITPTAGRSATINIKSRNPFEVTPDAMFFDVTTSGFTTHGNTRSDNSLYDPSKHNYMYFWRVRNEQKAFTKCASLDDLDNWDSGHRREAHTAVSYNFVYCFENVGTFDVDVVVYDPATGDLAFSTTQVTVGDPETFYAGDKTIYVNTTGVYTNSPTAGSDNYSTLTAAWAEFITRTSACRIVLEHGQQHNITSTLIYRPATSAGTERGIRIEANPTTTGARPRLYHPTNFTEWFSGSGSINSWAKYQNSSNQGNNGSGYQFDKYADIFYGIAFDGYFTANNPQANRTAGGYNSWIGGADYVLWADCTSSGVETPVTTVSGSDLNRYDDRFSCVYDCSFTNWSNFGYYPGQGALNALVGSSLRQSVDAELILFDVTNFRSHGPYRAPLPWHTHIRACDLFSNSGWSAATGSRVAYQPCVRWFTSPSFGVTGAVLCITDCTMETPGRAIRIAVANTSTTSRRCNAIIERNFIMGGFQTSALCDVSCGGTTFRYNIGALADVGNTFTFYGMVAASTNPLSASGNLDAPIVVQNNTFINYQNTNEPFYNQSHSGALQFTDVTVVDNLDHQPDVNDTPFAPATLVPVYNPQHAGYYGPPSTFESWTAHDANDGRFLIPDVGSPALGQTLTGPMPKGRFSQGYTQADLDRTYTTIGAIQIT